MIGWYHLAPAGSGEGLCSLVYNVGGEDVGTGWNEDVAPFAGVERGFKAGRVFHLVLG
jgi:hypothetical protein